MKKPQSNSLQNLFCFFKMFLFLLTVYVPLSHADNLFEGHYERAVLAYRSEQDEEALKEFQLCYKEKPLPRLLLYIARVYLRRGNAQLAIDTYAQFRKVAEVVSTQEALIVEEGLAKAEKLIKNKDIGQQKYSNINRKFTARSLPERSTKEFKLIITPAPKYRIQTNAIAGKGPNDIWVAGNGGVFHFDGTSWQQSYKGWGQNLHRVYEAGQGRLWAAGGGGLLLFYDKSRWHPVDSPATSVIIAVWQDGPAQTWIMDKLGSIWHSEGTEWLQIPTYERGDFVFNDAHVFSASSVWAVGGGGKVAHWDGKKLNYSVSGTSDRLLSVWGSDENCVWAVGTKGTALQFNGILWKKASLKISGHDLTAVSGSSCTHVCVSSHDNKAHTFDTNGAVSCFDGQSWENVINDYSSNLNAIWSSKKNSFFSAGSKGAVIRYNGSVRSESYLNTKLEISSLWGRSESDIWAVGEDGLLSHFDGNSWTTAHSRTTDVLKDLAYLGPNDIWAVGNNGTLLHFDGNTWQRALSNARENFASVVAVNPRSLWATGDYGLNCRYNGDLWMCNSLDQPMSLERLWASSPNNVWAIAKLDKVWRYDGQKWVVGLDRCKQAICLDKLDSTLDLNPIRIWGTSEEDVSVDTERGSMHFDGAHWSPRPLTWQLPKYQVICRSWSGYNQRRWLAVSPSGSCSSNTPYRVLIYSDDNRNWREFPYRIHHSDIRSLFDYSTDEVWVAGDEGIRVFSMKESVPISNKNETCQAIAVLRILPGSAAERQGLAYRDLIASYNHKCIHSIEHFSQLVDSTPAAKSIDLVVWRDGQRKEIHVNGGKLGIEIDLY